LASFANRTIGAETGFQFFNSELDGGKFRIRRLIIPNWTMPDREHVPRHAEARIGTALRDTRIVAIVGPRQSGKTTLARRFADSDERPFITLDDEQFRRFAQDDPIGFLRGRRGAVIDEIQRAPGLILELKKQVDDDPTPGRYLITGSVELFRSAISPDSLAGRVETIELLPFSQAEAAVAGVPNFLERAFAADFPHFDNTGPTDNLVERVVSGGFPEVLLRPDSVRRHSWLRAYARSLAERDISDVAAINKLDQMTALIDHAAVSASQRVNLSDLGSKLRVDGKTVDRWLTLLERMYLVRRIGAWHRNERKRLVKTPKLQFLDSGLLAALRRIDRTAMERSRGSLGPLLECFAYTEIAKAVALHGDTIAISHYRDKDGAEVDLVLERSPSEVVGIEVKAGATARPDDFKALARLEAAAGDQFVCGILLHDGERIQQTASRAFAVPIKMLWQSG